MMERIIRRVGGLVLLIAGFGLEGYFNASRFQAEGASVLIAWASAVVVALLYNLAFIERRRGAGLIVLAIFVGSFSVISTSASQSWAYAAVKSESAAVTVKEEGARATFDALKADLARLDSEADALTRQRGTVADVADAAKWRSALAAIDTRADEIAKRRDSDLARMGEATEALSKASQVRKESLYAYYHGILGVNADALQIALHTLFSVLLTLASPMGILALSGSEELTKLAEEAKPRHSAKRPDLSPERRAILDILRDALEPMRTGAIAAAIRKSLSTASEHLGNLERAGLVVSPRYGFWKVPESTQGSNARALPSEITGGEQPNSRGPPPHVRCDSLKN
jgi:DNA-binding transcriptional ArsR family regulator